MTNSGGFWEWATNYTTIVQGVVFTITLAGLLVGAFRGSFKGLFSKQSVFLMKLNKSGFPNRLGFDVENLTGQPMYIHSFVVSIDKGYEYTSVVEFPTVIKKDFMRLDFIGQDREISMDDKELTIEIVYGHASKSLSKHFLKIPLVDGALKGVDKDWFI